MKVLGLVLLCLASALPSPSGAQTNVAPPLGFLGVSEWDNLYDGRMTVQPGVPFRFHLWTQIDFGSIARPEQNSTNGLRAWELSLDLPPTVLVIGVPELNPPTSLNLGAFPNFLVGTGQVVRSYTNEGATLATFEAMVLTQVDDVEIGLGGAAPPTLEPPAPLWQEYTTVNGCTNPTTGAPYACLRYFDRLGTLLLNPGGTPDPGIVEVRAASPITEVGAPITVWIELRTVGGPAKRAGDPAALAGADIELTWDPLRARATGAYGASGLDGGWFAAFNLAAGRVRISGASAQGIEVGDDPILAFAVDFDPIGHATTVPLTLTRTDLYDTSYRRIDATRANGNIVVITGCVKYDPYPDGVTDARDAIRVLRIITGLSGTTPIITCSADVDNNGRITTGDVVRILRRVVGLGKSTAQPTGGTAGVQLLGSSTGSGAEVRLTGAAGAELRLGLVGGPARLKNWSYDGGASVVVNDLVAGELRVALASAHEHTGVLRLEFDVDEDARLQLREARLYDESGDARATALDDAEVRIVATTPTPVGRSRFHGAVPNPFNPSTEFRFTLERAGEVRWSIHDLSGRLVREIVAEAAEGHGSVRWDGTDGAGRSVASGVYVVRMESGEYAASRRVVLLK